MQSKQCGLLFEEWMILGSFFSSCFLLAVMMRKRTSEMTRVCESESVCVCVTDLMTEWKGREQSKTSKIMTIRRKERRQKWHKHCNSLKSPLFNCLWLLLLTGHCCCKLLQESEWKTTKVSSHGSRKKKESLSLFWCKWVRERNGLWGEKVDTTRKTNAWNQ